MYWIGSWLFGPRYYFEAILGAVLLTSAGVLWLAGNLTRSAAQPRQIAWVNRIRFFFVYLVLINLVVFNLVYYLPQRLGNMKGLYGASASQLTPFQTESAQLLNPSPDYCPYPQPLD